MTTEFGEFFSMFRPSKMHFFVSGKHRIVVISVRKKVVGAD